MTDSSTAVLQRQQFSYRFYKMFWKAVDWVFPPECPGCQKTGVRLCDECRNTIVSLPEPICPICGEPGMDARICHDCQLNPPGFNRLRSFTLFTGLTRESLHRLKYRNDIGLGEVLAPLLVNLYRQYEWPVDIVTAVPLSKKRFKSRGYNQAEELARPFAALIHAPYYSKAIQRIVDTKSQIDLSAEERRENVSGAFYANSMYVNLKSVIIIDDVSTTGSTISECAIALKEAGARQVYALTLARAPLSSQ